jgi:phospholipase C
LRQHTVRRAQKEEGRMTRGPVTLFSDRQFAGSSVPLDEGETRFPADFNDSTSSVRVASGYGAVLYEHANEFGGYGASVDLLEDCPDLSVYGFDKKTSSVRVFRTERDGFVYARGAMRDEQFVAGHWERKRASGGSDLNSTVAVVAPPAPPRTAPLPAGEGVVVRDHRGEATDSASAPGGVVVVSHPRIKHVFVLMLENRSFDHMLGFSGITGTDAATGQPTSIDGLNGAESNSYNGVIYPVLRGAPDRAPYDPPHGLPDVLQQLCGEGAVYVSGQPYPPINNSGFVSIYAKSHPELPDGAMRCFTPDQVPVLTALAQEFAVCDRWFCSMPGPTEPNRWFVHAGTAGLFDEGPSRKEYLESFSSPWSGIAFQHGTIFDRLRDAGLKYRIYGCDGFPNVALLKGISRTFDIDDFDEDFASDVASPSYDAAYTFIEPSYDALSEYEDGNSQHPLGSVRAGELLIKKTYEALRRSPIWESSLLIVTYDEHGGFYDHVAPPSARATGSKGRAYGFTFDQLGPRVPAVIVSPLIPRNLIDHRTYEHSSVISTLERVFRLTELTVRSSLTSDVKHLATLSVPRSDAPMTLPDPMGGAVALVVKTPFEASVARQPDKALEDDPTGRVAATLASGLAQHLEVAPPSEHEAIKSRVNALRTHKEALDYLKEVYVLVKAAKQRAAVRGNAGVRVSPLSHELVAEAVPHRRVTRQGPA